MDLRLGKLELQEGEECRGWGEMDGWINGGSKGGRETERQREGGKR